MAANSLVSTVSEGRALGEFRVSQRITEGGGGEVYLAEQPLLGRKAVIKIIRPEKATNRRVIEQFEREAKLASQLDHPYAAHVYSFGTEDDGLLWIAMERVHGETLTEYIARHGSIPLARFVPLLERICQVVHALHERGVVHRDLKPQNIMIIGRSGHLLPKLIDLGIAYSLSLPDQGLSAARMRTTRPDASPVGTPHYMAPEQWIDASAVDARTDQYALGAIAFECLTGELAFTGNGIYEIARAHASLALPKLGDHLPAEMQGVLDRALAKRPDERFTDVLEFASALRRAAGLTHEFHALPHLDPVLRQQFTTRAPQPLAEAVAQLEAARNPEQARDAIRAIVLVASRYVGLVTLAGYRYLMDEAPEPQLTELLDHLRHRDLEPSEWLVLARELALLHDQKSGKSKSSESTLEDRRQHSGLWAPALQQFLRAGVDELIDSLVQKDDQKDGLERVHLRRKQIREHLPAWVEQLGSFLRQLSFVCDYPLVVPRLDHTESWMGIRRFARRVLDRVATPLPEGRAHLVDAEQRPIVSLWPLVLLRRPVPDSEEALFGFTGRGILGARFVAEPQGFEHTDSSVWTFFGRYATRYSTTQRQASQHEKSPYLGLRAFTEEHSAMYFGRERETENVLNLLRLRSLLCFVGPSGAGKSSFVQAGLIPMLRSEWYTVSLRPGAMPLAALRACLEREDLTVPSLDESDDPALLGSLLRDLAERRGRGVVIFVDQFEELFTLGSSPASRSRFAQLLVGAARSAGDRIRVLLTLRDDFMMQAEGMPALRGVLERGVHLVGTPQRPELLRILVEPARILGYEFENAELLEDMISGIEDRPGALALLSFTARQLWAGRDRESKKLTMDAYRAMGGVGGALARHADETVDSMPMAQRELVRRVFRQLVTHRGTRAVLARAELYQVLGATERAQSVIERLISARLLVVWEGEAGEDRIEIAHEALLTAWPRLVQWRSEDAQFAKVRDLLREAANQWEERGRSPDLLWRGDVLAEYSSWRSEYGGTLTETESAFAEASLREATRGRRRLLFGAALAIAILILATAIPLWLNRRAESARQQAAQQSRNYLKERGRQHIGRNEPLRGLAFLMEAHRQGAQEDTDLLSMIALSMTSVESMLESFREHSTGVYIVRFSPGGQRFVAVGGKADSRAIVYDTNRREQVHDFDKHKGNYGVIYTVEYSPDSRYLLTGSWDKTARLWRLEDGQQRHVFNHGSRIASAAFSPDGKHVLLGGDQGVVTMWDVASGQLQWRDKTSGDVYVAFGSADGEGGWRVVTGDAVDVKIRTSASGKTLHSVNSGRIKHLQVAPCNDQQPVTCEDVLWVCEGAETMVAWSPEAGGEPRPFSGHKDEITDLEVSPDGRLAVTSSGDTARIWDIASGRTVSDLDGHIGPITEARFGRHGRRVITAGFDKTVRIWDVETGHELVKHVGHTDTVKSVDLSPDGEHAISASLDKSVKLWSTNAHGLAWEYQLPRTGEIQAAFDRQHEQLVVVLPNQAVYFFDANTGAVDIFPPIESQGKRRFTSERKMAGYSANGRLLVIPDGSRALRVKTPASDQRALRVLPAAVASDGAVAQISSVSISGDGQRLLTGHNDGTVRIWDGRTGQLTRLLIDATLGADQRKAHAAQVLQTEFARQGDRVVTASFDRKAKVWEVASGRLLHTLGSHSEAVRDARFSADGTLVVTASLDTKIRIWSRDGQKMMVLNGSRRFHSVDISPDNELIAAIDDDGLLTFWDSKRPDSIGTLGHVSAKGHWLAFTRSGKRIVTLTADHVLRAWTVDRSKYRAREHFPDIVCRVPYYIENYQLETKTDNQSDCNGL